MPLFDLQGREWAHRKVVKVGDSLTCDDGFTCLRHGCTVTVKRDDTMTGFESLFIDCDDGQHFLDGQLGDDGELVGLYPV